MSQSHKKENIIFGIILTIIVISAILSTFLAISHHNKSIANSNNEEPPIETNYFKFKEVSKSDIVDVYENYPVNPIDISYEANTVKISGLKDKIVEEKINQKLAILDSSENEYGFNSCYVYFNVSNVLSIECKEEIVNVNLINGNDIKLEEIFQKDTNIHEILWDSLYKSYCSWHGCYADSDSDYEYPNQVENILAKQFNKIKNGNYKFEITYSNLYFTSLTDDDYSSAYISFSDIPEDITIFNRFLTDKDIYDSEVEKYCNPNNCYQVIDEEKDNNYYTYMNFLNDKNYIDIYLGNDTSYYLDSKESTEQALDMQAIGEKFLNKLVKDYNLKSTNNNYKYIIVYANIYSSTNTYNHIEYTITINEYTKNSFHKYLLGGYEEETVNTTETYKINTIQYFNNTLEDLQDNPNEIFNDFENTLHTYITNDVTINGDDSEFNYYEDICFYDDDYEECQNNFDYMNLIKEAEYSVNIEEKQLYMHYLKSMDIMGAIIVTAEIPFDIFTLKDETIIPSE